MSSIGRMCRGTLIAATATLSVALPLAAASGALGDPTNIVPSDFAA
jgi:hypothetical protein